MRFGDGCGRDERQSSPLCYVCWAFLVWLFELARSIEHIVLSLLGIFALPGSLKH